jgi:heptaprenylglyceryl phosphate synthase
MFKNVILNMKTSNKKTCVVKQSHKDPLLTSGYQKPRSQLLPKLLRKIKKKLDCYIVQNPAAHFTVSKKSDTVLLKMHTI